MGVKPEAPLHLLLVFSHSLFYRILSMCCEDKKMDKNVCGLHSLLHASLMMCCLHTVLKHLGNFMFFFRELANLPIQLNDLTKLIWLSEVASLFSYKLIST